MAWNPRQDECRHEFEARASGGLTAQSTSHTEEIGFLLAYGNLPRSGNDEIVNFIMNNKFLNAQNITKFQHSIESFKFEMIDVTTNKKVFLSASDFQNRIKQEYMFSDVKEITPATFGVDKSDIYEGTYQYLYNNLNQTTN